MRCKSSVCENMFAIRIYNMCIYYTHIETLIIGETNYTSVKVKFQQLTVGF